MEEGKREVGDKEAWKKDEDNGPRIKIFFAFSLYYKDFGRAYFPPSVLSIPCQFFSIFLDGSGQVCGMVV